MTWHKDGIVPALLVAEITARMGRDLGEIYRELTLEFGEPVYDRVEAPATRFLYFRYRLYDETKVKIWKGK